MPFTRRGLVGAGLRTGQDGLLAADATTEGLAFWAALTIGVNR